MKTLMKKFETIEKEFRGAMADVVELETVKIRAEKDPCADFDQELHEAYDGMLVECGAVDTKDADEPAYNEGFNNWVDSILRDGQLQNVLPEYHKLVERWDNWETYKDELEEAIETMAGAIGTIELMVS